MIKKADVISPFHGEHDHSHCQSNAIETALAECKKQGLRLTAIRQKVLEIIWDSHNPIGAYDILQKLKSEGRVPAPPTAYRALDFLVAAKLVHRVESLNAYIGCPHPQSNHQCQFYICTKCGHIAELNSQNVSASILESSNSLGFKAEKSVIEVHGVCSGCQ